MANPDRMTRPYTGQSEQGVLNESRDEKYKVLAIELLAENEAEDALVRLKASDTGELKITGTITAEASTLAEFQFNDSDDTTTALTEYFGYTKPDGTWLVKKLTDTTLRYATITNNGAVTTYADAWVAIASLTYGRMDEAF